MDKILKIRRFFSSDWGIALFFLISFLLTHGYRYGWDDQHLELPLLKSLIDPELYTRDYYVQSLKQNFTSFFFPLLAKTISIQQIPVVYFILFLVSRYFLFYWFYRFWFLISQSRLIAFTTTLALLVLSKIPEFCYQTFSHQEFTLPIIFAGLYYFYKERFILAAILLGTAANFHAIYSLLAMCYMGAYLFLTIPRNGIKTFLKSCTAYLIFCLPFLIWTYQKSKLTYIAPNDPILNDWLSVFRTVAPEAFTFHWHQLNDVTRQFMTFIVAAQEYIFFLVFYIFNCIFNPDFRKNFKNHVLIWVAFALLYVYFLAGYIMPNKFILTMNFYRNTQFLHFILIGYAVILMMRLTDKEKPWLVWAIGIIFPMMVTHDLIAIASTFLLNALFLLNFALKKEKSILKFLLIITAAAIFIYSFYCLTFLLRRLNINPMENWVFYTKNALLTILYFFLAFTSLKHTRWIRPTFVLLTMVLFYAWYMQFHYHQLTKTPSGFDKLQTDWEDMQYFVRDNTPKNSLLLVPYDMEMGGFRMHSERSIVVCYRDSGIIGFDYKAILEWKKRIGDVEEFIVKNTQSLGPAVVTAVKKYNVDYIVFTTNASPESSAFLSLVYNNRYFSLYRVNR